MEFPVVQLQRAAEVLARSDALVIGAGAGMGVDSGLPDFRGQQGFWNAYPAARRLGLSFRGLANPSWFFKDSSLAWGFYGHRLNLYRETEPHEGFTILREWMERKSLGGFVVTSNVDGHFQKAGFREDSIYEIHGSLNWWQCLDECVAEPFPAAPERILVNEELLQAEPPLPRCPHCGSLARPNLLMFGDSEWISGRSDAQAQRFMDWLGEIPPGKLAVVELGAGLSVTSIRDICENLAEVKQTRLIRINPVDNETPAGHIGIDGGAAETLRALDGFWKSNP